MFWRRKKNHTADSVYMVQNYASQLGIERRRNVRIQYPNQNLTSLPSIFFGGRSIRIYDLSAGGVCLIDKEDHLGPLAGQDLELRLIWPECERVVQCRMVSRVDVRRHIQFMDLESERVTAIKTAIAPGVIGQTMKPLVHNNKNSVTQLHAKEVWSSTKGDSLSFSQDIHITADLMLDGKSFRFMKDSWPMTDNRPASPREVESILIFLVNFPRPSPAVAQMQSQLQTLYFEGRE